jgi:hypothetical protein
MQYQLREDLSFCRIDGHFIFLDIQRDRYFRLDNAMESALLAYIDHNEHSSTGFSKLIKHNILTKASGTERCVAPPVIKSPSRSVLEEGTETHKFDVFACLEVFAILAATKWQLKTRKLKDILDRLIASRQGRGRAQGSARPEPLEKTTLDAVSLFRQMRRYVPIASCCLLDSLSMVKFLMRRRLPSTIVVGVTLDPFGAHCWVQVADLMLNETLDKASLYTTIKII